MNGKTAKSLRALAKALLVASNKDPMEDYNEYVQNKKTNTVYRKSEWKRLYNILKRKHKSRDFEELNNLINTNGIKL